MRICITTGIFPPDIGGPATYVPVIAAALAQHGHTIIVITLSNDTAHDDKERPFRVVRLPRKRFYPLRIATTAWTIARLARRADVVFVNGLQWEAMLATLVVRKPVVQKVVGDAAWERARTRGWTRDDLDTFQTRRYGAKIRVQQWLRRVWTDHANVVVVPSQYLKRLVGGWGVAEHKITVVYNALEPIASPLPASLPLRTSFNIATVSRFVPWKHIDGILRAIAGMDDVGLVAVGDGAERERLHALAASLGIAHRVYWTGQRSVEDVHSLVRACDAFVLNSSYEGLPHIVLEAMQLRVPVIATDVGGTSEVVKHEHTGLLIPAGDDAQLAAAIRRLRHDVPLRERLVGTAAEEVQHNWSFDAMVERTESLLVAAARRDNQHAQRPAHP
jgi:glycosyltransferase involved in cell wall biosynthesis